MRVHTVPFGTRPWQLFHRWGILNRLRNKRPLYTALLHRPVIHRPPIHWEISEDETHKESTEL